MIEPADLTPKALLAAGLLEAAGELAANLTAGEVEARLRAVLTDATLWTPRAEAASVDWRETPARWVAPTVAVSRSLETKLEGAIDAIVPGTVDGGERSVVRVTVDGADDADHLAALNPTGIRVVPAIAREISRFEWRWPLRVGIAAGPLATRWMKDLEAQQYAGRLFDVRIEEVGPEVTGPLDILIMDGSVAGAAPRDVVRPFQATCVMMVGDTHDVSALLERASDPATAISVGVPADGVAWFKPFIETMAHDYPIDVAIAGVLPDARVAADPEAAALTAVGRWGQELGQQVGLANHPAAGDVAQIVEQTVYDYEHEGASTLSTMAVGLESVGFDASVVVDRATGGAEPAPMPQTPPRHGRELLGAFTRDGQLVTSVLHPHTTYQLVIRIAVPGDGESGVPFPEAAVPTGHDAVELLVVVADLDGKVIGRDKIVLPTLDRSLPSTPAVIEVVSGDDRSPLLLRITVLYENRPIQTAAIIAPVRSFGVPGDLVQLIPASLTARPEPDPEAVVTRADATLDTRGGAISRIDPGRDALVALDSGKEILDLLEDKASAVLGVESAPSRLDDPDIRELLIGLARDGHELNEMLGDLGLDACATIDVIVAPRTRVIPFELAYDGPAPAFTASLCRHDRHPPVGEPCREASSTVVCPYAFWGMHRVITRTIQRNQQPNMGTAQPSVQPLSLTPVLYAAADRADTGSRAKRKPTEQVQQALQAGHATVRRVTTWSDWRSAVPQVEPEMLVVLGHTTPVENREIAIEIGADSRLAQPDVSLEYLGVDGSPAPIVLLVACSSAVRGSPFGTMASKFTEVGAAAVIATLTRLNGRQAAAAAVATVKELRSRAHAGKMLGAALTDTRRSLLDKGLVVGLLLVAHGEIDVELT